MKKREKITSKPETRNPARLVLGVLACLVVVGILWPVQGATQETLPALFSDAIGVRDVRVETDAAVVRNRAVMIDFELMDQLSVTDGGRVALNLFGDVRLVATLDTKETGKFAKAIWLGTLEGVQHGTVTLSLGDGIMVGSVNAPGIGFYRIVFLGDGVHAVREIDPERSAPCKGGVLPPDQSQLQVPRGWPEAPMDDGSVQDVLVVYTQDARAAVGGTAAMHIMIDQAVIETNQGYNNSLVVPDMRLVGVAEVSLVESGDTNIDLARLRNPSDGFIDEVHEIRDAVCADLVCLIVDTGEICGRAYIMTSLSPTWEAWAFSVVRDDCATSPDYIFGHEIGHNQGCDHDRGAPSGGRLYTYSWGHKWIGDSMTQWRSVMAYPPGTRVNHYSNPDVMHDGSQTGVPIGHPNEAHNVATINNSSLTVSNFRESTTDVVWVDFGAGGTENGGFDYPFNTVAEGDSALLSGGTLVIKAGSSSETIRFDKPMTVKAYGGKVRIGAP
jgi:hypothetical protein